MMNSVWVATGVILLAAILFYLWLLHQDGKEVSTPWCGLDFTPRAGFEITSLPGEPMVQTGRSRLVNGSIAEIEMHIVPDRTAWLRVAVDNGAGRSIGRRSPMDFKTSRTAQVAGVEVQVYHRHGGPEMMNWEKDGFLYSLYMDQTEMTMMGGLIDLFVRESAARLTA